MERVKIRTLPVGKRTEGYTLLELLVVIVLLGIVLFSSTPRLRELLAGDDLSLSARRLGELCGELRARAVRDQSDYLLYLDLNDHRYVPYRADSSPEERAKEKEKARSLKGGVELTGVDVFGEEGIFFGDAEIRFAKEGYAQPAIIYLKSKDQEKTLFINPFLPEVKVWDGHMNWKEIMAEVRHGSR